jgi:hypothetical protein
VAETDNDLIGGIFPVSKNETEDSRRAKELYCKFRRQVETPENIGKMMTIDLDTEEFEIDQEGFEACSKLRARNPNGRRRFGFKIGYLASVTFGGSLKRIPN